MQKLLAGPARNILLALGLSISAIALPLAAQQPDLYSIPSPSRYSLGSFAGKRPLTRAERTGFTETSHYEDVRAFLDSLKAMGLPVALASMGNTAEGRALTYAIASRPLMTTPAQARAAGRPVVYVQGNIHAGEVEGKEASLALLRDLLQDPRKNVLDSIVLIVEPDYNADGNERWGPQARNRGAQNGPELVGTRQNASGWNLNRDYVDADAPETRGSLSLFSAWNPDLFVDLHTTDGSIHGYALTYAAPLAPAAVNVIPFETEKMLPEIRRRMRERHGFEINDYGDFSQSRREARGRGPGAIGARDSSSGRRGRGGGARGPSLEMMLVDSTPSSGWVFATYESLARYGTNYYGLRNRLAVLSEAFSHDPFARRVASTYDFVFELLSYVAEHRGEILALERDADARMTNWAGHPERSPQLALRSRMDTTRTEPIRVEQIEPLTDTTRREAGMGNRRRTGVIKLVPMPVMASFAPTMTATLPLAYVFDSTTAGAILPILRTHGIQVQQLIASAHVRGQAFTIDSVADDGPSETSRRLTRVGGSWSSARDTVLASGAYVVPASQAYGLLVFYLLEPESEDGLLRWSFFPGLAAGQRFPVIRVAAPAALRTRAAQY